MTYPIIEDWKKEEILLNGSSVAQTKGITQINVNGKKIVLKLITRQVYNEQLKTTHKEKLKLVSSRKVAIGNQMNRPGLNIFYKEY